MKIAVLRETAPGEKRVAATPETVKKLAALGAEMAIEAGAGASASVSDGDYTAAGATVGVTNFIKGVVTGVEQTDGKTLITINGVQIGWEKVTSIAEAPQQTAAADTNPDNSDSDNPPSEQAAT